MLLQIILFNLGNWFIPLYITFAFDKLQSKLLVGSVDQPYHRFLGSAILKDNNVGCYFQYFINSTCKVSQCKLRVKEKQH